MLPKYKLPLRGRVTVVNSLVLSTLWYILRLVALDASFYKSLRSIISQFINTDIRPPLSYANLRLPLLQGGLGLIDSQAQQHSLQLRWIENSLDPLEPNMVGFYLWDYLCRFQSSDSLSLLGLFLPKLHGPTEPHLGYFPQCFFQAFDSFPSLDPTEIECTPRIFLQFPIDDLFTDLTPDHWLHKPRPSLLCGYHFFCFDYALHGIWPLLLEDNLPYPRLEKKLIRKLEDNSLTLLPYMQIQRDHSGYTQARPFIVAFLLATSWTTT